MSAMEAKAQVRPRWSRLELISNGTSQPSVYLQDFRIHGPKPWGGGKTVDAHKVRRDRIEEVAAHLSSELLEIRILQSPNGGKSVFLEEILICGRKPHADARLLLGVKVSASELHRALPGKSER